MFSLTEDAMSGRTVTRTTIESLVYDCFEGHTLSVAEVVVMTKFEEKQVIGAINRLQATGHLIPVQVIGGGYKIYRQSLKSHAKSKVKKPLAKSGVIAGKRYTGRRLYWSEARYVPPEK